MIGIGAADRILIAENLDAQQADHGGDTIAIEFQFGVGVVTCYVEVHLDAANQFIEKPEGQLMLGDVRLELLVNTKLRRLTLAGPLNIGPPFREAGTPLADWQPFIVGNVVNLTTKGIEG